METPHWPLFGLRVRTPRLTLQYPDDDLVVALANLAAQGIHDPSSMPFQIPWTDVEPPELQRGTLQHVWSTRATWARESWSCGFAVIAGDHVVGVQDVHAKDFPTLKEATTGSWLGRAHQGAGIGFEMRQAVLHFLFDGLRAEYALSGAFEDNLASLAVSAKLPYERIGRRRVVRRGSPAWTVDLRMSRAAWERVRRDDIAIEGLDSCRPMFGTD